VINGNNAGSGHDMDYVPHGAPICTFPIGSKSAIINPNAGFSVSLAKMKRNELRQEEKAAPPPQPNEVKMEKSGRKAGFVAIQHSANTDRHRFPRQRIVGSEIRCRKGKVEMHCRTCLGFHCVAPFRMERFCPPIIAEM